MHLNDSPGAGTSLHFNADLFLCKPSSSYLYQYQVPNLWNNVNTKINKINKIIKALLLGAIVLIGMKYEL